MVLVAKPARSARNLIIALLAIPLVRPIMRSALVDRPNFFHPLVTTPANRIRV